MTAKAQEIYRDTLAAQLGAASPISVQATLSIPEQDDRVIYGYFERTDYNDVNVANVSRLITYNRFITAEVISYVKGMTLDGAAVKQIMRDLNGATVIWLS